MQTSRPPVSPVLMMAFGILAVSTAALFIRYAQVYAPSLVIATSSIPFPLAKSLSIEDVIAF